MRNIAFETNRLKGRSTIHKNMVYWEESCVIFTPPLSSLPPRVISSLLPIFLQLSCLARCFIRSENPLNFLRKFANLINDGAKILTLFTTKRKKRRSLEKNCTQFRCFFHSGHIFSFLI